MQVDLVSHEPVKKELLSSAARLVQITTLYTRQEDQDSNPGSQIDHSMPRNHSCQVLANISALESELRRMQVERMWNDRS